MTRRPPPYDGGRWLHLVRHGRPLVEPGRPAATWQLDPSGLPDIDRLRDSGRLPRAARWFSSPEPKALETAHRLLDGDLTVVEDLREQVREGTPWLEDAAEWRALVTRAFAEPDRSVLPGWEPLSATQGRVLTAVRGILTEVPDGPVVLVGHGTAWTTLVAALTGRPPDLDAWAALRTPDVWDAPVVR